ncbi:hypothetical protein OF820_11410 [Oceanotoga sp. DSM 15011]|jgi:hypothetical protein|uniref:Uncharacterized protein n=1 Tax=Oceanotoga teriensis TaxID=515440 RepID=A0AA45C4N9_9BACT|nr:MULTISPECIES: hypothetical protein [Oceanotoga]MDN5343538.1 hypothetical protein [Oceanotoga sp.]MDO7977851.1 hypothetical protein [Oceanotoga teriensis]PWJ86820.1 hypothetical protein C7380_12918 [Oceanotoga teriensis]UYO99658.1 hypothetical protein OF820_11410 [Oceanotoga sp. DSM 15011]
MNKEELLKRKRILEIEKNAIEKYMGPHEHDESLKEEWERLTTELEKIEKEL